MPASVLILTLNEEANLQRCLESVSWSDDIVIFDSGSTDRTVDIARSFGARIYQRPFDNERAQRTAALEVGFLHSWVYSPDADEVTPPELRDEILSITSDSSRPEVAYRVRFKNMFCGRWIKHASLYPTWILRLFRPECISYSRSVNVNGNIDGVCGRLEHHLLHYSFNKGLDAWIEKHNRYSHFEALETIQSGALRFSELVSRNPVVRRRALKELSMHLPFRPSLRFLYMYVVRGGFLDGLAGLTYCRLLAMYEYMIVLKVMENKRRQDALTI